MDQITASEIAAGLASLLVSIIAWVAWRLHVRVDSLERTVMPRAEIERQIGRIMSKLDALVDKNQIYRDEARTEAAEMLRRIEAHLDDLHETLTSLAKENEHRLTVLEQRIMSSPLCSPCAPSLPPAQKR